MKPDWRKIEFENPGLVVRSAGFLGEGWNSRAYLVNNEHVFRFPQRAENWDELKREIKFLAFAACKLPLAVPQYVQVMPDSPAAECGYAVYRYLRGHAMNVNLLTQKKRTAAADTIATFLRTLHGLQLSPELTFLLPREDARINAEEDIAEAEREIVPKLLPSEAETLRKQFEMYLSAPANFSFRPAVLHSDLSRDHLLMEDDAVVAIIDFGDVCRGDPDYDFMYLFVDFGQAFVKEVARRYEHPDLEQLGMKLQYFGMVDQIGTILHGEGRAPEGQTDAAWRRLKQLLQSNGFIRLKTASK